jgi:hypothetical protein
MEQEHFIIIALLCVVIYMLLNNESCGCNKLEGFEQDIVSGAHIRSRREGGALGLVNADTPISHIRSRRNEEGQGFNLQRINVNNNMNQSQFVRHHLKMDHRSKMMQNMAGCEGQDCAGAF